MLVCVTSFPERQGKCSIFTRLIFRVSKGCGLGTRLMLFAYCKCNIEAVSIIWTWWYLQNWMTLSKIEAVQWIRMREHLQNDVQYKHRYKHRRGCHLTSMGVALSTAPYFSQTLRDRPGPAEAAKTDRVLHVINIHWLHHCFIWLHH